MGPSKTARRREELRRNLPRPTAGFRTLLERPEFGNAIAILIAFVAVAATVIVWSREQVKVAVGQIMLDTRLERLDYEVVDEDATQQAREEARAAAPRVYQPNTPYLERLAAALNGLPTAVAGKTTLEEISEELKTEYKLTVDGLEALQPYATADGKPTQQWQQWVSRLIDEQLLLQRPVLESKEFQNYVKTAERVLMFPDGRQEKLGNPNWGIELSNDPLAMNPRFGEVVQRAHFGASVCQFVINRLAFNSERTITFDADATERLANRVAAAVEPVFHQHKRGEIIFARGDTLNADQLRNLRTESERFRAAAGVWRVWLPRLGTIGLITILISFGMGFVLIAYPRITRNAMRLVAITILMGGMLAITVVLTRQLPQLMYAAAIAPTLLVAIILLLAYDQRLALFLSTMQCILVTLALNAGTGWVVLLLVGCGTMVAQLGAVRHRQSMIRAATVTAASLGIASLLIGFSVSPGVHGIVTQILGNSAWCVASSIIVGFLVLGLLPSVERLFDITTGMTLAELRDPSQPLLRQLQQLAPGTYNHSLQIANIAEAAADAIGADGLLVYVGALYHDIGKMNKPDYFVENQVPGDNKHDKLRPAMSLLVIIGHVKDGIELAREYGLPRQIQHFIESHHGTTLVEYFYHAARTQAEMSEKNSVDEIEFRYPGPKPQTKEAAILMLADAVESATRAMAEPNPGRIESLVRDLARKRLLDGQFDECDLTFRELGLIQDAIVARVCAIHHSRISYPSTRDEPTTIMETAKPA
jgi:cyclic-di-AMP phosphodiesterase PgpH